MTNTYRTIRVKEDVYKKFKRIKKLLEFQNNEEYEVSQFLNYLTELESKKLELKK